MARPFWQRGLFWFCLHTSKTGTLYSKYNRHFVVSVLDSRIHFHPACTTSWVYETNKKVLLSHFDKCNTGRDYCPGNVLFGLEHTSAADTSLLANGETVFSILFALVIFKERMKPIGYLSVALILFGIFIATTNLKFKDSILRLDSGNLLVIGSTIL
ncbi:MAG: EamA family transporter [Nitrososphaeraceae archaeon]